MKMLLLCFILLITGQVLLAQDSACLKKHLVGRFTYPDMKEKFEVIRTDSLQTEIYNGGKSKLIFRIKWLSPSEYLLILLESVNVDQKLQPGLTINVKVIRCDESEFTTRWDMGNRDGVTRLQVLK